MSAREKVLYWVKPTDLKWTNQEPIVAYWEAWMWWLPGDDTGYRDKHFEALSERIPGPDVTMEPLVRMTERAEKAEAELDATRDRVSNLGRSLEEAKTFLKGALQDLRSAQTKIEALRTANERGSESESQLLDENTELRREVAALKAVRALAFDSYL